MKKNLPLLFIFALCLFSGNKSFAQINFTAMDVPYTQNFDAALGISDLYLSDNDPLFPGLYTHRVAGHLQPQLIQAYVVTNNIGRHYNFGTVGAPDRAFGTIYNSASGIIRFGFRFKNNTGSPISALVITYTGEQWRTGGSSTVNITNTLAFDYLQSPSITDLISGSYTAFDALSFISPTISPYATTLDGNLAANRTLITATLNVTIADGEEIMIRWTDVDDTSLDHALGIDDLSVTPKSVATRIYNTPDEKAGMTLYPNPVNNVLKIVNTTTQTHSFEIFDMTGRKVASKKIDGSVTSFDVADLPKGVYLVRTKGSGKMQTSKFIKN
jgi:hypothetical protein